MSLGLTYLSIDKHMLFDISISEKAEKGSNVFELFLN